jgi:hypothetical protein
MKLEPDTVVYVPLNLEKLTKLITSIDFTIAILPKNHSDVASYADLLKEITNFKENTYGR